MLSNNNPRIPTVNFGCTIIKKELEKKFLDLREGDPIAQNIEYKDLLLALPREYKIYLKSRFDWFVKITYIFNMFTHLFIPPNEVHPNQIIDYKLVDMSEFFTWASKELEDPKDRSILLDVKRNYKNLTKKLLERIS